MTTTNNVDLLDPALGVPVKGKNMMSTRTGRIDFAIEFKVFTEEQRYEMARKILCDCPQYINDIVKQGEGLTPPVQFQGICSQKALEEKYKNISA